MTASKEGFEEWFDKTYCEDFRSIGNDYYGGQYSDYIEQAWNHQQKKISMLEAREKRMLSQLIVLKEDLVFGADVEYVGRRIGEVLNELYNEGE